MRFALGAVALAATLYLLPASVQIVAWPSSGPERIALLPPLARAWWSLLAGITLFSALAATVRHDPQRFDQLSRAVLPLALLLAWLIPFLPWLPDRAPLLLTLAGPLRWVVAVAAFGWTVSRFWPAWTWPRVALPRGAVFVVSLLLYAGLGLRFTAAAGFGGDEPHYLVITHSLFADHDLDIANNHERRDYKAFYAGELRPDYLQRSQSGQIYSIHAPGLPLALVPAYAVAGAFGAVVTIALLAALTALAVFDLAAALTTAGTATLVWIGTCLTVPFVPHAWLIYPELPGALIVAWSALWLWRGDASPGRALLHGAVLASLPWLHTKFIVLLALLAALQAVRLWPRIKAVAFLSTPIAVSLTAWLYFFYRTYGTLDPEAPYGSSTQLNVLIQNIPHGMLGLLFDQKFGVVAYSPVYLLALVGLVMMWKDAALRIYALSLAAVAGAFLLSSTRFYMWWGGSSAPARFFVPVIPLLAPMIAVAIERLKGLAGRAAVAGLLTVSVVIAGVCVAQPKAPFLFNDPHGLSALVQAAQGAAPLNLGLPVFTEEDWFRPLGLLVGWLAAFGAGVFVAQFAIRSRRIRSSWGAAATTVFVFGATATAFEGGRTVVHDANRRAAVAFNGQLGAMRGFDAARLRAVDLHNWRRLSGAPLYSALTLAITRQGESASPGAAGEVGPPFELPEGDYEARVWLDGVSIRGGELTASLAPQVVVGRSTAPFAIPAIVRFRTVVPAPIRVVLSDPLSAAAWRRIELAPLALAAGAARSGICVTGVEAIDGRANAYMAYQDDHAYAEGGVFWTRGIETTRLTLVPAGATQLHLILLVGPTGGLVTLDVGGEHLEVNLTANETRDIAVPLPPGLVTVPMSVRSSRDFRPADVDHASDDQRRLGCQVRPRLGLH
jgi:hypothetical protein